MPTFVRSVLIAAPVPAVFGFHERDDALALLSPSFPPVRVNGKTGGIEAGSRVELQIGPFKWVALHSAFEKNRFFEDRQVSGPFAMWGGAALRRRSRPEVQTRIVREKVRPTPSESGA